RCCRRTPTACSRKTACSTRRPACASGTRFLQWAAAARRWNPSSPSAAVNRKSTPCCATTAWSPKPPEAASRCRRPRYHAACGRIHIRAAQPYFREVTDMTKTTVLLAALALAIPAQAAQLYRWVDDKGRVEWRDTPPPATAKKVEKRSVGGSVIETSTLPYSQQQAVRNFPVTLYAGNCGEGCDKARAHLVRRGIPFTPKDPQHDVEGYRKLTNGGMQVPLLFVGRERLTGYEA